jgi:hypothetical protein
MNQRPEHSASTAAAIVGQLLFSSLCVCAVQAPSSANAQSLPGLPNPLPPLPDNLTFPVWFPPVWSQALISLGRRLKSLPAVRAARCGVEIDYDSLLKIRSLPSTTNFEGPRLEDQARLE